MVSATPAGSGRPAGRLTPARQSAVPSAGTFGIVSGSPEFLERPADDPRAWCPHPQPEEHLAGHPPQPAGGAHGAFGLGQVVACLRHPLCRGAAPLCGIALGLRPAVPAADGQARRGHDRGALSRHCHRAEVHQPQPALHRRHRHRDQRLPAAALCPHRHPLLPRSPRPAAGKPERLADGGRHPGPARRHPADDPRPRGAEPQGRAPGAVRTAAGPGLRACAHPQRGPAPWQQHGGSAGRPWRFRRGHPQNRHGSGQDCRK